MTRPSRRNWLCLVCLLLAACSYARLTPGLVDPSAPPIPTLASSGAGAVGTSSTFAPIPSPTVEASQLYLILDADPIPIENGEIFPLTESLGLGVTVDPYPPVGLSAQVGLDLYLTDELGAPVRGAAIEIIYDMLTMAHGPYESVILDRENGHYLTSLELLMFGAWGLKTQIRVSEGAEPLELTIVLFLALPPE